MNLKIYQILTEHHMFYVEGITSLGYGRQVELCVASQVSHLHSIEKRKHMFRLKFMQYFLSKGCRYF
jgi:hypothetical protein